MSRIGKMPVVIPDKVDVRIDGLNVKVKGPLGALEHTFVGVNIDREGNEIKLAPVDGSRKTGALWGLGRALLQNMVTGVSEGFTKVLEIHGIGYRAELQGKMLTLTLGHSHPVNFVVPQGIEAEVEKPTVIKLKGADKQLVGQTAATIRGFRPPEPYKGKGVRYRGEYIRRKAGKAGATA